MTSSNNSIETIAAIATPIGVGGISVIRISGPESFTFVDRIFRGKIRVADADTHTIHYGNIVTFGNAVVDTVLISVFKNPHSYTGEDVCEISSHGGYFVSAMILDLLYAAGASAAQPGEFTLRAFLNGKLDLVQAEAVADLIHSKSEKSHKTSIEQLNGRLSKYTKDLRQEIIEISSLLELELDFSQEGIELVEKSTVVEKLVNLQKRIEILIESYSTGKHIREGVRVSLVGKPNAGKSSLLNALLEEERAIVSHIPGTTRDTIEESLLIGGLEFIFTDTAGLRESGDIIEQEGIKRTTSTVQSSDIVVVVVDSSVPISNEDLLLYKKVQHLLPVLSEKVYLLNKSDITLPDFDESFIDQNYKKIWVSCKTGTGLSNFKETLKAIALPNYDSLESSVLVNNLRHKLAFENALDGIKLSIESIKQGLSDDFVSVDLRRAVDYLGEIIGITTPDEILNNIFSKFCIGK
jgi:tRNA modification GTPase